MPRFLILVHATPASESGSTASPQLLTAMAAYNADLTDAGILRGGDGLHPSSSDAYRISFDSAPTRDGPPDTVTQVTKGPFALTGNKSRSHRDKDRDRGHVDGDSGDDDESGSLIAGYWIFKCRDVEEAVEWAKKAPMEKGAKLEVRRIIAEEDFGEGFREDLKRAEGGLRDESGERGR